MSIIRKDGSVRDMLILTGSTLSPRDIADAEVMKICAPAGFTVAQVKDKCRSDPNLAVIRQASYGAVKEAMGWGWSQTGRYFNRTHGAIYRGVRALEVRMKASQ